MLWIVGHHALAEHVKTQAYRGLLCTAELLGVDLV